MKSACTLAIFLSLLIFARPRTCKQPSHLIAPPTTNTRNDFCIRQATLLQASWMRELVNGSCQLLDLCSNEHQPPLYRPLSSKSRLLLLRCRADRNCDPHKLLTGQPPNSTFITDQDLSRNTDNFKSPMIDLQPMPFSHIDLILLNISGGIDVNLTFAMNATGRIVDEGTWFSLKMLESAYPWNITVMKTYTNYKIFSMALSYSLVRFYIKTKDGTCEQLAGFLRIFPVSNCRKSFTSDYPMVFLWTKPNPKLEPENMVYATQGQSAIEFRLYGRLASKSYWSL